MLAARPERLSQLLPGDDAVVACIAAARGVMLHALRREIETRPLLDNFLGVCDYLHCDMAPLICERIRVLHLDVRNRLIGDEVMSEGTTDEATVHVREIVRRALELGSTGLLLAHNHPGGDHTPSRADIDVTRRLAAAAKPFRIVVHDHIVISATGETSMRALNII